MAVGKRGRFGKPIRYLINLWGGLEACFTCLEDVIIAFIK
jgi:hypothetical protein